HSSSSIHYSLRQRHLHSFPTRRSSDLAAGMPSCTMFTSVPTETLRSVVVVRISPERLGSSMTSVATMRSLGTSSRYAPPKEWLRSEEHTSELQSPYDLVCRLLLEKKKT